MKCEVKTLRDYFKTFCINTIIFGPFKPLLLAKILLLCVYISGEP